MSGYEIMEREEYRDLVPGRQGKRLSMAGYYYQIARLPESCILRLAGRRLLIRDAVMRHLAEQQ